MFKLPLIKTPDNKAKSLCDPNFNIFHLSFIYLSSIFHEEIQPCGHLQGSLFLRRERGQQSSHQRRFSRLQRGELLLGHQRVTIKTHQN